MVRTPTFAVSVFASLAGLGFTPSVLTASSDFAAMLRRESEDVCSYIYFRDDRGGNGPVAAHYWVAPPDFPDDGLDNLGIGFKIAIASTFTAGQEVLAVGRKRIEDLLPAVPALAQAVGNEARSTTSATPRLVAYREQLALHRLVMKRATSQGGSKIDEAIRIAAHTLESKGAYRDFVSACRDIVSAIKSNRVDASPEEERLLSRPAPMLEVMLSRQMYVEMLVPLQH